MPALKTERRVFMWRMTPRAKPSDANGRRRADGTVVHPSVDEIVSLLEAELTAGRARVYLGDTGRLLDDDDPNADEKHQIYIAEIKRAVDKQTVTILVNRGDPNIVSPAFIRMTDLNVRVEEPEQDEAPGASAHLVIALNSDARSHRACFEKMPHVSSSLVLSAMERIVSRAVSLNPTYKYEDQTRDSKGRAKFIWRAYRPIFESAAVPSERLIDDLEVGELSGVTLTRRRIYYTGPGMAELVTRQEEKVVISLKRAEPKRVEAFLQELLNKAKEEEYESVTFNIEKLPGNATNNPTLTLDDKDALEQLYVRAQRIADFDVVLEQCYPAVCEPIEHKMIELLKGSGW